MKTTTPVLSVAAFAISLLLAQPGFANEEELSEEEAQNYARELLKRSEVRAERDGIAVFADAERWTGKPVQTGERLLQIADPGQAELRIELAVGDAIALAPDAQVALFLDSDPLQRHLATLQRAAYEAQPTPGGQLAYRLDARFDERAPLALYLLRRPLAGLRQSVGL